ncbi:MAG: hypothetical protein LKJ90_06725 [Faecalibacterium sp.]|nr:hypothetical protein [Faecalibacterium sp.]
MRKSLTIAKRGAALALAGAMACSCALGAAAQGSVKKEETVYATLASDGTVQKTTDSVWLHDDGGLSGYATDTGLSDITMLKDTENPQADGSKLTFGEGTDAYYQGTADAALPVTAEITYTLDGTAMTAEELAGKSGHLVMHISLTNNSYQMKTIGGVSRRVCTPFVTVIAATLDTDTFTDITAEHGTIETDASKDLVAYVCLPGMKECFDGLLKDDLSQISDKLYDDVTLEADVTDFEMPMLYIAAATDAADFSKESELSDFNDLFDELDGLDDKLNDMMDGVDELLKGSNDLNNGASELYNGIQTLDTGAATLQTGAHNAATGAGTLSSGLNTLSGNSQTLRDSAGKIADAVLASANSQLKAAGAISNDLTWDNYATVLSGHMNVTDAQIAAALTKVATGAGVSEERACGLIYLAATSYNNDLKKAGAAMQQAAADSNDGSNGGTEGAIYKAQAALTAASNDPKAVPEVATLLKMVAYQNILKQLEDGGANEAQANLILTYAAKNYVTQEDLASNLNTATSTVMTVGAGGGTDEQKNAVGTAQQALTAAQGNAMGVTEVDALLAGMESDTYTAVAGMTGQSDAGVNALLITMAAQSGNSDLTAALPAAGATLTNANTVKAAMTAATDTNNQIVKGYLTAAVQQTGDTAYSEALGQLNQVNAFVKGINDYTAGVDSAASGAGTLKTGLDTLASGTDTLKTGADKLLTGASTLKNGTGTLVDGVQELYDGVNEAYNKLENGDASDLTTDDLQNIKDTLDAIKTQRESYKSFAGDAAEEGSVKFVMKVSAEKAEDTEAAAAPADTAKTGNFFTNLWQRIVALFHN